MQASFERDAVRPCHLRRRTDLNGVYGLVQSKQGQDVYEVLTNRNSVLAKFANMEFVQMNGLSANATCLDVKQAKTPSNDHCSFKDEPPRVAAFTRVPSGMMPPRAVTVAFYPAPYYAHSPDPPPPSRVASPPPRSDAAPPPRSDAHAKAWAEWTKENYQISAAYYLRQQAAMRK